MKRLARILDRIEPNIIDVARQSPARREGFYEVLPLRLRKAPEAGSQGPIPISLGRDFKRRIERTELAELAVEREVHETFHWRIRRRPL